MSRILRFLIFAIIVRAVVLVVLGFVPVGLKEAGSGPAGALVVVGGI